MFSLQIVRLPRFGSLQDAIQDSFMKHCTIPALPLPSALLIDKVGLTHATLIEDASKARPARRVAERVRCVVSAFILCKA